MPNQNYIIVDHICSILHTILFPALVDTRDRVDTDTNP